MMARCNGDVAKDWFHLKARQLPLGLWAENSDMISLSLNIISKGIPEVMAFDSKDPKSVAVVE